MLAALLQRNCEELAKVVESINVLLSDAREKLNRSVEAYLTELTKDGVSVCNDLGQWKKAIVRGWDLEGGYCRVVFEGSFPEFDFDFDSVKTLNGELVGDLLKKVLNK